MRIHLRLAALAGVAVLTLGVAGSALAGNAGPGSATGGQFIDQGQSCGVEPLDVVLVLDTSGSMEDNSNNGKTRLEWAQLSAKQLVDALDANGGVGGSGAHHVGLTVFSGSSASVEVALGTSSAGDVKDAIDALSGDGATPLQKGMAAGAGDMVANDRGGAQQILIILSDGQPNPDQGPDGNWAGGATGERPTAAEGASYLGSADIAISVAVGQGGTGYDEVDLGLMALLGPDGAYHVLNAGDLPDVFENIYVQIACPTEPPVTEPPVTEPPVTEPPVTEPPVTEPPVTEPPVTEPPVPTPTFEQSFEAETDAPTLPPTTIGDGGTSGPTDSSWLLVVLLGVALATIVVLTPAPARKRS
jgi:hypothetical protein